MDMINKLVFYVFFLCLIFTSCEKFDSPNAENLRGEYVIDKITFQKVDNTVSSDDSTYYPGSVFENPDDLYPLNKIQVGYDKWRFDYNIISMAPVEDGSGGKVWTKQYYIDVSSYSGFENGYLIFNFEGTRRVFRVVDRQIELLILRSSGHWPFGSAGSNRQITITLTRVGP